MVMSGPDHRRALDDHARSFASAIHDADLTSPVPDCPGWTVQDLILHTGGLYRWSTTLVRDGHLQEIWRSGMELDYPPADADVRAHADWVAAAIDPMLEAFSGDEWAPVWTWGSSQRARFWPRRMLFETLIHRLDLDRAMAGSDPVPFEPAPNVASECLDELFELLGSRGRWATAPDTRPALDGTIVLAPTDVDMTWRVRCRPTGMWWDHGTDRADVVARGPIAELVACTHQRGTLDRPVTTHPIEVSGDTELFVDWLDRLTF